MSLQQMNIEMLSVNANDKGGIDAVYYGDILPVRLFEAANIVGLATGLQEFFPLSDIMSWAAAREDRDELAAELLRHLCKSKTSPSPSQTYEEVNGPAHYDGDACLREMVTAFGPLAAKHFCVCNAWKYRYRAGRKPGQDASKDEAKAKFYMDYAKKLDAEMEAMS